MPEQIITKTCRTCKETKPISEFHKNRTRKDGHQNECKICCSKYDKAYQQNERVKIAKRKTIAHYQRTEKGKATIKHYQQSEKGKASQYRGYLHYRKTEKGKAAVKRYKQSKKGKATAKRYNQSEKGKINRNRSVKRHQIRHPKQRMARNAVNHAIESGRLPRPDSLQCHYCPAQAKQYHHHKGYEPEHWLDVIPVCIKCHHSFPRL